MAPTPRPASPARSPTAVAAAVPLATFRDRMLLWLGESGRLVAPGYCEGDGLVELAPADLAARLTGAAKPHVTAA